jgi:hypothetical protein
MRRLSIFVVAGAVVLALAHFAAAVENNSGGTKKKTVADCEFDYASCYFRCETIGAGDRNKKRAPVRTRHCKESCKTKREMCIKGASDYDGTVSPPPARTFTPRKDIIGPRGNILDPGSDVGTLGPAGAGSPVGGGAAPPARAPSGQIK